MNKVNMGTFVLRENPKGRVRTVIIKESDKILYYKKVKLTYIQELFLKIFKEKFRVVKIY